MCYFVCSFLPVICPHPTLCYGKKEKKEKNMNSVSNLAQTLLNQAVQAVSPGVIYLFLDGEVQSLRKPVHHPAHFNKRGGGVGEVKLFDF